MLCHAFRAREEIERWMMKNAAVDRC